MSTTVGKNSLEEMEYSQQNSLKLQSKSDRMISVCFQGKPFNITVIQVYASTADVK